VKIDEMQAGREMDALVAEKVMELPKDLISTHGPLFYTRKNGTQVKIKEIQYYSTEIAAAWEVVEKLRETGKHFFIRDTGNNEILVKFSYLYGTGTIANTVPLAICRAALKDVLGRDEFEL
jgi:hypothetical protein